MKSQVISQSQRRQIQQTYQRAVVAMSDGKKNRLLVHRLLSDCILRDPATPIYINALLENLGTTGKPSPRQTGLSAASSQPFPGRLTRWRSLLRNWRFFQAAKRQSLSEAIRFGLRTLYRRPQDLLVLCRLADLCLDADLWVAAECYLRHALTVNPGSHQTIQLLAQSLLKQARFEESLHYWRQLQPGQVEQTSINQVIDCLQSHLPASVSADQATLPEDDQQRWLADVQQNPTSTEPYLQWSKRLIEEHRWDEASDLLDRGLAATGAHPELLDQQETIRLESGRHRYQIAEQLNDLGSHLLGVETLRDLQWELERTELQVFERRARRYPTNARYQLQLAVCLRRAGNYLAALKQLAQIPDHEQTWHEVALETGKCHQHLHQFEEAAAAYGRLLNHPTAPPDLCIYQQALYHGGILTAALGNSQQGQQWLSRLLEISPDYQDAGDRLDKIVSISDNSGEDKSPSDSSERDL